MGESNEAIARALGSGGGNGGWICVLSRRPWYIWRPPPRLLLFSLSMVVIRAIQVQRAGGSGPKRWHSSRPHSTSGGNLPTDHQILPMFERPSPQLSPSQYTSSTHLGR